MQAKKLLIGALCLSFFAAYSCRTLEPYTIDAPEDLAQKIAEYEAEKEAGSDTPDDAVVIEVSPAVVGTEDNSSGWWTEFSQYFTIPVAKKLTVEFTNYGGASNWNNWVLACTTAAERGGAGYAEYFVIRSDNYGWGDGNYNASRMSLDIDGQAPVDDPWWATFREKINNASVVATIDHASEGTAYVSVVATALDGSIITETYNHPVSFTDDVNCFFVADGAHIKIEKAYISSSAYPILPDSEPAALSITGAPASIPCGTEDPDFWGNAKATVTFEDGSTLDVAKDNLVITEPDLSTPGTKTVIAIYNLTKKGVKAQKPVAGYYTIEAAAEIESLEIVTAPSADTYYFFDNTSLSFRPYGIELQANYAGGLSIPVSLDQVTISDIELVAGTQNVTFTYKPGSKAVTATTPIKLVKGSSAIGLADLSTPWWQHFYPDVKIPEGESITVELDQYSKCETNWNAACTILRKADKAEYCVVRLDNHGWGAGFVNEDANKESDWNWDLFAAMQNNAHLKITASNNGSTAEVRYDVLWENGEIHHQVYKNIAISNPDDVYFSLVPEAAYLVIK